MRNDGTPRATLLALLPTVVGSIGAAEIGLVLSRWCLSPETLRASNDVVGNYLQTLGTVYAVLLAFVVFVVWTQFNEARTHVETEATELHDLVRTARGLPDRLCAEIHGYARRYVDAVLEREWDAMAKSDDRILDSGWLLLDDLWAVIRSIEPATESQKALHAETLARFNDLCDARTRRLTSSRLRIPLALRILLYSGACATVGSMYLFAVDSYAIHAVITGALAGAVSHVLYVVADLDNCFSGAWSVPSAPLQRVRKYLLECAQPAGGA